MKVEAAVLGFPVPNKLCVRVCVRACVRACLCAWLCMSVWVYLLGTGRTRGLYSRSLGDMIHGRSFKTFSTPLFDDIRIKQTSQKRVRIFVLFKHILKALFVGIPKVQEQGLLRE